MKRSTLTIIQIFGIILLTAGLSALAYYSGSKFQGPALSALSSVTYTQWQATYLRLIYYTGATAGILLLMWYLISRFSLKVNYSMNIGQRTIWFLFGFLTLIATIVIPKVYAMKVAKFEINNFIIVIFAVLFTIFGYWLGSIFFTPSVYKYTPLGAEIFRSSKSRK